MTTEELLAALEAPVGYGGHNSEDSYEIYDELRLAAAKRIRELITENDEDQSVIAVWRGRAQRAEAEIERLQNPLRDALAFIARNNAEGQQLVTRIVTVLATEDKP